MFVGGDRKLFEYIAKSIKYPVDAQTKGIQGRVIVKIIVNKDGKIIDPRIERSVDPLLDTEALRIVKAMPDWIPGKQRGKPVDAEFLIPITFRLE
jgi:TonB family C-terminal domain